MVWNVTVFLCAKSHYTIEAKILIHKTNTASPLGVTAHSRENLEKSGVQRQTLMKTNSKEKANEPTRVILP
jgi:hypothetical protein